MRPSLWALKRGPPPHDTLVPSDRLFLPAAAEETWSSRQLLLRVTVCRRRTEPLPGLNRSFPAANRDL
jgi:hypothetical protein